MKKLLFAALVIVICSPVFANAATANAQKGKKIFESICAACHGSNAQGVVGPNIVNKPAKKIKWALTHVAMMKPVASSHPELSKSQNIQDIAAFLHSLKK